MKRFISDLKKYMYYCAYSAKTNLKAEVANSYLNWIWWVLEPLCNMLVYYFVFGNLLGNTKQYYIVFIYSGLLMWNFFNRVVLFRVKAVRSNKGIVTRAYVPKYVLLLSNMILNLIKLAISCGILVILMVLQQVPISGKIIYVVPIYGILILWTFGCGTILLHFGVFVDDLTHAITILMHMLFFLTGIFYDVSTRIAAPFGQMILTLNPVAACITSMRQALIYGENPDFLLLGIWTVVSVFLCCVGVKIIYKYENSYVKVV